MSTNNERTKQPLIESVSPNTFSVRDGSMVIHELRIHGKNFEPQAAGCLLGDSLIHDTKFQSSEELICRSDMYASNLFGRAEPSEEGFVAAKLGLVVLNDTLQFSPGSISDVYPLTLHIFPAFDLWSAFQESGIRAGEYRVITGTKEGEKLFGGTSCVGRVPTTYDEIVAKFGEPAIHENHLDAGACEWLILFEDGTFSRIYPHRFAEAPPKSPYYWHVGGNKLSSLAFVAEVLGVEECEFTTEVDPEIGSDRIPF